MRNWIRGAVLTAAIGGFSTAGYALDTSLSGGHGISISDNCTTDVETYFLGIGAGYVDYRVAVIIDNISYYLGVEGSLDSLSYYPPTNRALTTEVVRDECFGGSSSFAMVTTGIEDGADLDAVTVVGFTYSIDGGEEVDVFIGVQDDLNPLPAAPANTAPTSNAGPDQTVASAANVTLDGSGSSDADSDALTYAWSQTSGTSVTLSSTTAAQPTFTAPTLAVGDEDAELVFSLTVNDGTASSSADTVTITVEAPTPTPATAFADNEEEIREVIQSEAGRSLRSTVSANQRMVHDARTRFIECGQVTDEDGCFGSRNEVAFDVDGSFVLRDETLSTSGTFFQQTGNFEGTQRRLFFGDFDVQHDDETGSTTATMTGRMAWEQMVSDSTMLGYFIGGELAYSNIDGEFEGDQDRIGLTVGGYLVHQLAEQVYFDGFLTFGAGRNNLEMANDVLELASDYTTRTATIGAALSGVYDYSSYEFRPELAFTYGRTWIGNVDFTGRAYGLVDDTLSLDAGAVSIGTLILRPEVVWGLDADTLAQSNSRFSFAPRLICESVEAGALREDCGGGVELGLSSVSEDGLSEFTARVLADRIGNSNRSSFAINLELRF